VINQGRQNAAPFFLKYQKKKMKQHPFMANSQFPGQRMGQSLDQVRDQIIFMPKAYGQRINVNVGNNPANDINLPRDGQKIIGISLYYPYQNAGENPQLTLNVNNTIFLESIGFRSMDQETIQSRLFLPLDIPLAGNDRILIDINNVTAINRSDIQFYYI
jgi:hypothetical protein